MKSNNLLEAHKSDIFAVGVSEEYTITASGDGFIKLWDNSETEPKGIVLDELSLGFHHISTNGSIVGAVNFDGKAYFYDIAKRQRINAPGKYFILCYYKNLPLTKSCFQISLLVLKNTGLSPYLQTVRNLHCQQSMA